MKTAITPKINKHMTHAEDIVLFGGIEGINWLINLFKDFLDHQDKKLNFSIKFDGAPSIFMWSEFPGLKHNGLAIKALFNKNPKLIYSESDIYKFYNDIPELCFKLKAVLPYVSNISIPRGEIWQGDFLFDQHSLQEDDDNYSFHPNTIIYKVSKNSDIGRKIKTAEAGIVWHTRYTGSSLENMSANYNLNISELNRIEKIYMTDPYVCPDKISFSNNEISKMKNLISIIENEIHQIDVHEYYDIIENKEFISFLTVFQNYLIKYNLKITQIPAFLYSFKNFITQRYQDEIELRKTDKAKNLLIEKRDKMLNLIKTNETLIIIIDLINYITELKTIFIKKINNIGEFKTFLQTNDNIFIPTGHEGFAISDINGNVVKLVDRYEFSFANFSPTITKGWNK